MDQLQRALELLYYKPERGRISMDTKQIIVLAMTTNPQVTKFVLDLTKTRLVECKNWFECQMVAARLFDLYQAFSATYYSKRPIYWVTRNMIVPVIRKLMQLKIPQPGDREGRENLRSCISYFFPSQSPFTLEKVVRVERREVETEELREMRTMGIFKRQQLIRGKKMVDTPVTEVKMEQEIIKELIERRKLYPI